MRKYLNKRLLVTPTQLIADVGGMAGFMLGMSVATVVAFIDSGLVHQTIILQKQCIIKC